MPMREETIKDREFRIVMGKAIGAISFLPIAGVWCFIGLMTAGMSNTGWTLRALIEILIGIVIFAITSSFLGYSVAHKSITLIIISSFIQIALYVYFFGFYIH